MTLRKKGARLITVDQVAYRWVVRRKPTYSQGIGESSMTIAIEHVEQLGSVLVIRLPHPHPGNWLGLPAVGVSPAMVALAIRTARDQGWQPERPGGPFQLDLDQPLRLALVP